MHHNIEAEQQLLGAILLNNEAMHRVVSIVEAEHFYEPIHQTIFEVLFKLVAAGKLARPQLLKSLLPADVMIGEMPLQQYIARLMARATTVVNAPDFALSIRDDYDRRCMAEMGYVMCGPIADPVGLATELIERADQLVSSRVQTGSPSLTLDEALARAMQATADAYQNQGQLTGLSWGLKGLDQKTLGMQAGELIVLAGRPGMGKTALALCVARNLALAGHQGILFSLEMSDVPLTHRMIADEMYDHRPLAYTLLRSGGFHESVFERIRDATQRLRGLPLKIEQQAALTLSQIAAKARRHKKRYGLKYIMVDHLGLMKSSGQYKGNKVLETGEITAGLKALAKELDIVVIALAQLNRQVESREDKRPNLADLRHSGDIEQDADTVIMLYRAAYYVEKQMPDARPDSEEYAVWEIKMRDAMNKIDVILEKQRNGPVGTVRLHCAIASNAVRDLNDVIPAIEYAPLPDDAGDLL